MVRNCSTRPVLPLGPLLDRYRAIAASEDPPPALGFSPGLLDGASDAEVGAALLRLARSALPVVFHADTFERNARFLRHALSHLLFGHDPLPRRLARCVTPGEAYHVPGTGPGFWAAVLRCAFPDVPLWCPSTEAGLRRLGLLTETPRSIEDRFAGFLVGVARLRGSAPDLTADQLASFLARVGRIVGRELPTRTAPDDWAWSASTEAIQEAVRQVRTVRPLRRRLRETPPDQLAAVHRFVEAARVGEYDTAHRAFRSAHPGAAWEAALPALDDAFLVGLDGSAQARLWYETARVLRDEFRIHPLELADVVERIGNRPAACEPDGFRGFCTDSFAFLGELADCNCREWMAARRERYRFAVREPLTELCQALAGRYVEPVLNGEHGWDLESTARPGLALTSICRNDFGRGAPYQPVQWITFYRRSRASKRADAQFFVRLGREGLHYGFHLGRSAREAGGLFRKAIQESAEAIYQALQPGLRLADIRFWTGDDLSGNIPVRSAADLRAWAAHKTLAAGVFRPPSDPAVRSHELVGEVLLTFDRLLPLFVCAVEPDPLPLLRRRAGSDPSAGGYDAADFRRDTYLPEIWLDRVLGLLRLKRQLILQGVPGTGKTHVARCLARLLTGDRPDQVRLVQFHPSYSYEEFVEGIRVRNTAGTATYAVEDGVLCEFAAQAAARPSQPHVLIVDELNRGNLSRVLGELLFLLEYREQSVTLPYSKRAFRLPDNLYLVATLNPLDRSAVALDQALRRRFSFVEMPADAAVLARWLEDHPPADPDETLGPAVVRFFEELNARLERDLGPGRQVGHSFFMVPALDREKLAAVWEHHVRPLLLDYLGGRADRLRAYEPDRLFRGCAVRRPQ